MVVLGGGVAGLAAADRLCRAGWGVRVIERAERCGGNHRARHIGPYTFDVGSIFYEHDARIFDLAPGLRDICPTVRRIQRRIAPDGSILHYPLEPRDFLGQAPWKLARSALDMAWSRLTIRRDGTLDAIARQRLGGGYFRSTGLASYLERFHHVPPEEIDESFFFHRMAFVERFTRAGPLARTVLRAAILRRPVGPRVRPPLHVRPRQGFERIFDPVERRLAKAGVEFRRGEELLSLRREGGMFRLRTTCGTSLAQAVVSTIPIDTLHRAMFGTASGLASLDMTTLFVSAGQLDKRLGNVLFNFHPLGHWKRSTIYSRIYPGTRAEREFMAVEATIPPGGDHDPERIFADFDRHMGELDLAADLRLEGHEHVRGCYPLYTPDAMARRERVMQRIAGEGVVLAGRLGRFEYLPTSSGVIRRVREELDSAGLLAPAPGIAA